MFYYNRRHSKRKKVRRIVSDRRSFNSEVEIATLHHGDPLAVSHEENDEVPVVCSVSSIENPINCDHKSHIRDELNAKGLVAYLASPSGGELNMTSINTLVLRLADMLTWTYAKHCSRVLSADACIEWMKEFIVQRFKLIASYVDHLLQTKNRTPATVLHTLNDIKKGVIWFLSFRDEGLIDDSLSINRGDIDALFHVIKAISRHLTKVIRRDRSSNDKNTLSGMVFQRHLPTTGLKGLIENLRQQLEWTNAFIEKIKSDSECFMVLDKDMYDMFMQTLFASLYVFSPQGRVGAIAELNCKQGLEMLKYGYTQSNAFKTSATYGYQPVLIADVSATLLHDYIMYLRPRITGIATETSMLSHLWVKFNGKYCTNGDISHSVSR